MKIAVPRVKLSASLLALAALVICSCHKQIQKSATDITDIAEPVTAPSWIKFKSEAKVNPRTVFSDPSNIFHVPPGNEMRLHAEEIEELGRRVFVFQLL